MEEFAKNNGFDGCFRVSAKTGLNINEAMNYLVDNIIKRSGSKEPEEEKISNIEKEKKSKVKKTI